MLVSSFSKARRQTTEATQLFPELHKARVTLSNNSSTREMNSANTCCILWQFEAETVTFQQTTLNLCFQHRPNATVTTIKKDTFWATQHRLIKHAHGCTQHHRGSWAQYQLVSIPTLLTLYHRMWIGIRCNFPEAVANRQSSHLLSDPIFWGNQSS